MNDWFYMLEILGTAVFAVSGALAASRAEMDIFGFSFLSLMPAIGGGTLRDIVLGRFPVFWISDTNFVLVAIVVAVLVFLLADQLRNRRALLVWMDAAGLSVFAVVGTEIALRLGTNSYIAVTMGVVTAVAGGIIRDVICNEIPLVLTREIYATAAFAASAIFAVVSGTDIDRELALGISIFFGFLIRGFGIRYGLSLPSLRKHSARKK